MKVTYLKIENFRGIQSLELQPGEQVNVFAGINGAGKSSVLDAIRILLSWMVARLHSSKGRGVNLLENDIYKGAGHCFLKITLDNAISWQLYKQSNTNRSKSDMKTDLGELMSYVNEKITEYGESPKTTDFTLIDAYTVNRIVTQTPSRIRKKHMLGALDAMNVKMENSTNFHSFFLWFREREDIENEKFRFDGYLQPDKQLDAIRQAMHSVFPEYGNLRVKRGPMDFIINKGHDTFCFSQLSDGEKVYIALIADISRKLAMTHPTESNPLITDGIIIIDEIDLHLHPSWQNEVLSKLKSTFPGCQFFLSTHSPYVISDMQNTLRDKLISMNGGKGIVNNNNFYGQQTNDILYEVFGMDTLRNKEVQKYIDHIWEILKGTNEYDSERLNQNVEWLKQNIDASDPEFIKIALQRKQNEIQEKQ